MVCNKLSIGDFSGIIVRILRLLLRFCASFFIQGDIYLLISIFIVEVKRKRTIYKFNHAKRIHNPPPVKEYLKTTNIDQ